MATKADCRTLEKVEDDEPIFVLRAQDRCAPKIVRAWAAFAKAEGAPREKVEEALDCAAEMERWAAHGEGQVAGLSDVKVPRAVLVGEDNPLSTDPRHALYPLPRGAAGDRLRHILGVDDWHYLHLFERRNLCAGRWSVREAAAEAERLMGDRPATVPFVLLGAKVCRAFGFDYVPFKTVQAGHGMALRPRRFYLVPHPSGRSRAWNDDGAPGRARRTLAPLVPHRERPDLDRCQAERVFGSFLTLGSRPRGRCRAAPGWVATERRPGADGARGSTSLCAECRAALEQSDPDCANFRTVEQWRIKSGLWLPGHPPGRLAVYEPGA